MEKEKLGQDAAFPFADDTLYYKGMSKRFYAACAAMQGIIAAGGECGEGDAGWTVKSAFNMADELLKQENE